MWKGTKAPSEGSTARMRGGRKRRMSEPKSNGGKKRRSPAELMHERRYKEVKREFAKGNATRLLSKYLRFCLCGDEEGDAKGDGGDAPSKAQNGKKERKRFPNPAGFCRFLGLSSDAYHRLECEFPTEAGRLYAVFLDEALNSDLSATMLGFYLRHLLGEGIDGEDGQTEGGGVVVTFEHDIFSDGR